MSGNIETMVDQASQAFANGDDITALALFNQALALSSGNESNLLVLHSNIGAVLMNMRQQDSAIKSFDRALGIDPQHVESQYNKGLVLLEQNKFTEALHLFNTVCLTKQEFYLAQCSRCDALLNLNRFVEARDVAKLAINLEEDGEDGHVTAHVLLGIAHYHLKDYSSANLAFSQVRGVDSLDALAKQVYSLSLMGEGLATNNVTKMEMAIEIYPTDWENYHNLGVLLVQQQQQAAVAKMRFEQALERNPESFYTLIALGSICLDVGEFHRACEYLKRACELDSENPTSRFNLGVALVKCNEVDLARAEFAKLDSTDANALRALEMLNLQQQQQQQQQHAIETEVLKHTESFVSLKSPAVEEEEEEDLVQGIVVVEDEQGAEEEDVVVVEPAPLAKPEQVIDIPTPPCDDVNTTTYVPYADLKFPKRPPLNVDPTKKETYLSPQEFAQVFGKTQQEFILLPAWKKTLMKKDAGLF